MTQTLNLVTLDPHEYQSVRPLFADLKFYRPFLECILTHRCDGKVVVDDRLNPSFALVLCPPRPANLYAPVYFAGEFNENIIPYLKSFTKISLLASLDWNHRELFEEADFIPNERMQLRRPDPSFEMAFWDIPKQYSLSPINEKNFKQCNWYSFIAGCFGSEERFFKNGVGFCLTDQGKIVSESYAIVAGDLAEIGVVTDEAYRGQNLGTCICAQTLDYCYQRQIDPVWNCDINNFGSVAIAKKLGFQEDVRYLYLNWIAP